MLQYQNWVGTTLRFCRSEAIHWTMKRMKNSPWPTNPITNQVSMDITIPPKSRSGRTAVSGHAVREAVSYSDVVTGDKGVVIQLGLTLQLQAPGDEPAVARDDLEGAELDDGARRRQCAGQRR